MSTPAGYTVTYSFVGWQTVNPNRPLPASAVDNELANVSTAVAEVITALGDVRRSDGALNNGIVTYEAMDADVLASLSGGAISAWASVVDFTAGIVAQTAAPTTVVVYSGETYVCTVAHTTTSTFDPAKWKKIAAKGVSGTGSGDMLAANNLSDVVSATQARTNLGLGSVNNTADADKPVSTATQNALDAKVAAATLTATLGNYAALAGATFTGAVKGPTTAYNSDTTDLATTAMVQDALDQLPLVGGYSNLVVTVTSDTALTVTADTLTVESSTGRGLRLSAVSLAVAITTSGANGLDTGVEAASTWYHVWAIAKVDGTTAGLLSASSSNPTMPTGYVYKKRVGAVKNNGSSNLFRSIQYGDTARFVIGTAPAKVLEIASNTQGSYSSTTPTWAAKTVRAASGATSFVPPTACSIVLVCSGRYLNGVSRDLLAAPNGSYTGPATDSPPPFAINSAAYGVPAFEMMLESNSIYIAGTGGDCFWGYIGWRDNL